MTKKGMASVAPNKKYCVCMMYGCLGQLLICSNKIGAEICNAHFLSYER